MSVFTLSTPPALARTQAHRAHRYRQVGQRLFVQHQVADIRWPRRAVLRSHRSVGGIPRPIGDFLKLNGSCASACSPASKTPSLRVGAMATYCPEKAGLLDQKARILVNDVGFKRRKVMTLCRWIQPDVRDRADLHPDITRSAHFQATHISRGQVQVVSGPEPGSSFAELSSRRPATPDDKDEQPTLHSRRLYPYQE